MPRTVFPCREFEPVAVPLDYLLVDGEFSLYPEAEKFFDLDFRDGAIVVAPKSFVGLIPVNDRVTIHVLPRFPISNLFHILHRSSATLRFIEGHIRSYRLGTSVENLDPLTLLADQLVTASIGVRKSGLLRRYVTVQNDGLPAGEINFPLTVSRYRSSGIRHKQVWNQTEHSVQLRENELIKLALQRLLGYLNTLSGREHVERAKTVRGALFMFDSVAVVSEHAQFTEAELAQMVKRLPASHTAYGPLLWLAYLIHARKGISIEQTGNAQFETFVVNMADVFEDYVRQLVADSAEALAGGARVKDGNTAQVNLFVGSDRHKVKPDIYLQRGATNLAVLDAKYKPSLKAADRYEVLAFCEALATKKAILISPATGHSPGELLGKTPGGIEMWSVKIDLAAQDMRTAEATFIDSVRTALA